MFFSRAEGAEKKMPPPPPPRGRVVFLGGGSTPPRGKLVFLGGGSTPPSSNLVILGGGSGVSLFGPPPPGAMPTRPDSSSKVGT